MKTANLPQRIDHKEIEKKWQKYWAQNGIFQWQNDLPKERTFVIDTPPPTVSGLLHMGHVFSYTQADFVARFKRMRGFDVFYPMGFDDNGLPTERLVEKVTGKRAIDMDRSEFVEICKKIVADAEVEFEELFNSIALSVDWNQKYQTISPTSQKISQLSFLDLFEKGLVERKLEPVLWDVTDRTALSQADLVDKEKQSSMNDIEFGIEGSDEKIIIATTRPELLPACVAVMVHPEDLRYQNLIGKNAITALFGVKVKIIADELVQQDKGTGAVMCCTFGDETDILWWRKHKLEVRVILEQNGVLCAVEKLNFAINKSAYEKIVGLYLTKARTVILEILKAENLLKKSTEITHVVKCAERSGTPIEILVIPQWFVKILDKKEELKAQAAKCNWYPQYMKVRIDQWIDGVSWDWCISRQRFFGVPFPIWYSKRAGEEGKILIADAAQLPCDPLKDLPKGYSSDEVIAETDIMDTWATSSISPQLSSRGITKEKCEDLQRHEKLFPADLRPQAHEIIRTWAFYTIVKAYLHEEQIPWKNLMISGWCLAADKTKMSKSKGNVITPTSLIEEKGSDIVRYWASTSHLGADTAYSEDVFKIGQKLLTKLFNSAKFAAMNFGLLNEFPATSAQDIKSGKILCAADLWILSKLNSTIKKATNEFEKYEYAKAREAVEDFFWNDFCDNYLEIVKVRSYGINAEKLKDTVLNDVQKEQINKEQLSAIYTLYHCLENILKLFAPFIPHICDEIYSHIFADNFAKNKSIHARNSWAKLEEQYFDEKFVELGNKALEVIFEVRKFKSDNNLSMKTTIEKIIIGDDFDYSLILEDLKNVCNAAEIEVLGKKSDKILQEIKLSN